MPETRNRPEAEPSLSDREPVYARDAELIRSCLAGDDASWQILVRRYHDFIYSVPRRYGLDEDDSADVYQSVCIALWKGLSTLRSEKALTRWIQTTAVRMSGRLARKRRRESGAGDSSLDEVPEEGETIVDVVEQLEEAHRVRKAVERLPDGCARLLRILYLSDPPVSYDEASVRLGVPRGSLGPTRARCIEKLRLILRQWR